MLGYSVDDGNSVIFVYWDSVETKIIFKKKINNILDKGSGMIFRITIYFESLGPCSLTFLGSGIVDSLNQLK